MDTREPTGVAGTLPTPEATAGTGPTQGGSTVKNEAKTLLQDAKQETSRLADVARERVNETATSHKDAAAEKIGTVAGVLRDAGQRLEDEAGFGRYAHNAAEQVDRLAHYLRRSDLGGMVRDAETFARRHPELFLGLAFLGGMVATRFLKSSPPRHDARLEPSGTAGVQPMPQYPAGYPSSYGAGYGYQSGAERGPGSPGAEPHYTEPAPFDTPRVGGPATGGGTSGTGGGDL